MKKARITLCWLPPAKPYLPSPSMTVLKQTLLDSGFDAQIIYWNILLEKILLKYFFNEKKVLNDEIAILGPFYAYIAIECNDKNTLIKQELYLRALKPQYTNNNFNFQKHIRECISELETTIINICNEHNVKESLFVGMHMSLFQWVPAYVLGIIIKRLNPDTFIAAGGIGNPKQAKAYIKNFKYIDLSSWGEGESIISDLANKKLKGEDLSTLSQCYIRKDDSIVRSTVIKKEYADLDKLQYSDFYDFFKSYKGRLKDVMIPIEGARGCHWNRCHFCFLNQGYKYRRKSAEVIKEEILYNIKKYSVYDFTFLDNDVIGKDREKFNFLLDKLIEIKNNYPKFRVIKWAHELNINVGGMNVLRGLLEENLEDIKESVQNLHFMRFYQLGNKYKHEISSLAINDASRYFNRVSKSEIQISYSDAVKEMLPDDFLPFEESLSIYQYVRKFQAIAWDYFVSIESHYAQNKYSYELTKVSNEIIRYTEYYNSNSIRIIDFNRSDLAWKVLELSNKSIITIEQLGKILGVDIDMIKKQINELRDVGLLYVGKQSKECISIINTLNIL